MKDVRAGTSKSVNAALKAVGAEERITRGKGYIYFTGGNASAWRYSSVPVPMIKSLTVSQWIDIYHQMVAAHAAKN